MLINSPIGMMCQSHARHIAGRQSVAENFLTSGFQNSLSELVAGDVAFMVSGGCSCKSIAVLLGLKTGCGMINRFLWVMFFLLPVSACMDLRERDPARERLKSVFAVRENEVVEGLIVDVVRIQSDHLQWPKGLRIVVGGEGAFFRLYLEDGSCYLIRHHPASGISKGWRLSGTVVSSLVDRWPIGVFSDNPCFPLMNFEAVSPVEYK